MGSYRSVRLPSTAAAVSSAVVMIAGALLLAAPAATAAAPTSKDMTFFLHFVNATETSKTLPGAGSTWTYFDTTTQWNDANVTFAANGSQQTFSWYLSPSLAGPVTVSGYSFALWVQFLSGTPNAQTTVDLLERNATGAEALVESANFGSQTYSVSPALKQFNWTLATSHNFAAGSSIKIDIKINPGTGSMLLIFDTARADSRLVLKTADALAVASVSVLDYNGTSVSSLDPLAPSLTATFRAVLSDPYGGYDIVRANLTILDPSGATIVSNASMALVSGTPISLASTFDAAWNYSGRPAGAYTAVVYAMDNNGLNWFTHFAQFSYGPYGDSLARPFFIGGLPYFAWVRVVDDRNLTLEGAAVALQSAGVNTTVGTSNASGLVNLTGFAGNYTLAAWWGGVEVAAQNLSLSANVTEGSPVLVRAAVYYPTLAIVDSQGAPLADVFVYLTGANGTTVPVPLRTDAAGQAEVARAPLGGLGVRGLWRGTEVAQAQVAVNSSGVYVVAARVYTLTVTVTLAGGAPLPYAGVLVEDSVYGLTAAYNTTNASGSFKERLPVGTYDLVASWSGAEVANATNVSVTADTSLALVARVYTLTVVVRESGGQPLADAAVSVVTDAGAVFETAVTGASGALAFTLPGGVYGLTAEWGGVEVANLTGVALSGDTTVTLEARVFRLGVHLQDAEGAALADAGVTLRTNLTGALFAVAVTDTAGNCAFRVPSEVFDIAATWRGVQVAESWGVAVTADANITVSARVFALTLKVVDAGGAAVAEAGVTLTPQGASAPFGVEVTDAQGQARFRAPGQAYTVDAEWRAVVVAAGQALTLASDATVTVSASIYRLSIQVVDGDATALGGAAVTLSASSGVVWGVEVTPTNGSVSFRLPGQTYAADVLWSGVHVGAIPAFPLTADSSQTVNASVYTLTVKAVGVGGNGLAGASVTLTQAGRTYATGITGADGTAAFHIPGGTYGATVRWVGTAFWSPVDETQDLGTITADRTQTGQANFKVAPGGFVGSNMFTTLIIVVLLLAVLGWMWMRGRGGEQAEAEGGGESHTASKVDEAEAGPGETKQKTVK